MHSTLTPNFLDRPLEGDGHGRVLIPDGLYTAQIKDWRTFRYMGDPRVEFSFEILEGDYVRTPVGFFTGVKQLIGKESTKGEFVPAGRQSNLGKAIRSVEQLSGHKPTFRKLIEVTWEIQVITIKMDAQKQPLNEADWYSKVTRIRPISLSDW